MYSDVVMEVNKSFFEKIIDEVKKEKGIKYEAIKIYGFNKKKVLTNNAFLYE